MNHKFMFMKRTEAMKIFECHYKNVLNITVSNLAVNFFFSFPIRGIYTQKKKKEYISVQYCRW